MSEPEHPSTLDPKELYKLAILRGVSLASVEDLLEGCEVRALAPGDVLLSMGQQNRVMYMILSGRLSVHLEGPTSEPVALLEAGETVGELSVMDATPASAFVVAAEPARLLAVEEAQFWNLVNASHDFAINLLFLLTQRLRSNNSTVTQNIRLQREYKRNAMIDGLTGLYNRRWIDEALPRFVTRYARGQQPLAILIVDIDHFKSINDTFGHPVGDRVLVTIGQTLRAKLRPSDLVARYGGEEFLVILPDTHEAGARLVADRVREAVQDVELAELAELAELGRCRNVTISLGGAVLAPAQGMAELLETADKALYAAKDGGRNCVMFPSGGR